MYTSDILVLIKGGSPTHIYQLIVIFDRFRIGGLKINVNNFSFGLKYITYLGCVITRYVVKPDQKKGQLIMDIGRPTTTASKLEIISILYYYIYT